MAAGTEGALKVMGFLDKKWGISRKSLFTIILITFLITALMCVGGSVYFSRAIQRLYNERGYVIANIILEQTAAKK